MLDESRLCDWECHRCMLTAMGWCINVFDYPIINHQHTTTPGIMVYFGLSIYYLLTPWSRVLLENLTGFWLVEKFPTFCGTRRFITSFTSARHLSLSWASSIQSIPAHPTSWRSILIFSHLRLALPSGLFPSGFPTKTLYTPFLPLIRSTCPAHLILLDLIIVIDVYQRELFCPEGT